MFGWSTCFFNGEGTEQVLADGSVEEVWQRLSDPKEDKNWIELYELGRFNGYLESN